MGNEEHHELAADVDPERIELLQQEVRIVLESFFPPPERGLSFMRMAMMAWVPCLEKMVVAALER